jgi:Protein of unknown function (DUF1688)
VRSSSTADAAVAYLSTPEAIRERAGAVLAAGLAGRLTYFTIDLVRLAATADLVATITRERYPDGAVPPHSRWRHFDVGGHRRIAGLERALGRLSVDERVRAKLDLAVVSVLLDAGAGSGWRYVEAESGQQHARSEGLAVASLRMFEAGFFSADRAEPARVDAEALLAVTDDRLAAALQVSAENPLTGLSGRAALLRQVGRALQQVPELFGKREPRPGHVLDALREKSRDRRVEAAEILGAVLTGLGSIWPGRLVLDGVNLGDVWPHPAAGGTGPGAGLVPLHKLSQWLTYSLIEPLAEAGLIVGGLDRLTALAEYRNGGLLLDTAVLVPRQAAMLGEAHAPSDEVVVEWRALTVALLDRLAPLVRDRLGARDLSLASILEGGTWAAGRRLADERRGGEAPIRIESDGTVM